MADVQRGGGTAAEYFASPAVSRSDLALFANKGAATYKAIKDGDIERETSASMELGTAVHTAILEPERWAEECASLEARIVQKQDFKGKGARTAEKEWRESLPPGSIVCTTPQREARLANVMTANAMARSLATRKTGAARLARRIIAMSEREIPYTWTDTDEHLAAGPMRMRCRLDLLHLAEDGPIILDLKTTADPEPDAFGRSAAKYLYPWQGAVYSAPLLEETGIEPRFGFIMIRSSPPYEVAIRWLSPDDIRIARIQVRDTMRQLSACIASNDWSSPWEHQTDQNLNLPRYWANGIQ